MTDDEFWQIIEASRAQEQATHDLTELLRDRPSAELAAFDQTFRAMLLRGYRWDLWGAAYLNAGGCSDDGFEYFRTWLIMQGRAIFEQIVQDPDRLAELDSDDGFEMEGPQYAAASLYAEIEGGWPERTGPSELSHDLGESWDFDDLDEMRRRYPALAAKVLG